MGTSNRLKARLFRVVLTLLLALVWTDGLMMVQSALAQQAAQAQRREQFRQIAEQLERLFGALQTAASQIPRESFAPQAIVAQVGKDPSDLLTWVRDNTYWVPYRGVLRGPAGVLMDRLGNSLDRSLLLAELLRLGGHQVRLAQAALPAEQAQELVGKLRPLPQELPGQTAVEPDVEQLIASATGQYGLDAEQARAAYQQQALTRDRMAEDLAQYSAEPMTAIRQAMGQAPPAAAWAPQAAAALADHWWVQCHQGSGWVDLDPLLPDAQSGNALAPARKTAAWEAKDSLSAQLAAAGLGADCQQVSIRIIVEQAKDGKLVERTALDQPLTPAEVLGQPITLTHAPTRWSLPDNFFEGKDAQQLQKALLEMARTHEEWLPVLRVGNRTIAQSAFSTYGELNAQASPDPAQQLGTPMQGLFGGLGGEESPPAKSGLLTAEWIEYEIRVPGQEPRQIRREVFDVLGPAARASGRAPTRLDAAAPLTRGLALLGQTEVLLQVCRLSEPYVQHLLTQSLLANRELLVGTFRDDKPLTKASLTAISKTAVPLPGAVYGLTLLRDRGSPVRQNVYLDQPNILSLHTYVARAEPPPGGPAPSSGDQFARMQAMDIVENTMAVRPGADAFATRLQQGVLDTAAEAALVGGSVRNAARMWDSAADWKLVRPDDTAALSSAGLSADTRARVEQDLADGWCVLVPQAPRNERAAKFQGWWRVDPRTGQTLGMGDRGWGAAVVDVGLLLAPATVGEFDEYTLTWFGLMGAIVTAGICTAWKGFAKQDVVGTIGCVIGLVGAFAAVIIAELGFVIAGLVVGIIFGIITVFT